VRRLAWLHAIPKAPDRNARRIEEGSRISKLNAEERVAAMGGCALPYLRDILFEVGPTMPGAMGSVPVTHEELRCWQLNTGLRLFPWECLYIVRLSREWCAETERARDPMTPKPGLEDDRREAARVTANMRAAMRGGA
jgi:hypothetical protein